MCSRPKQKLYKIPNIPIANACSYPWAVVVVDFDADPTVGAVKTPWRPQKAACLAIRKPICFLSGFVSFFVRGQILKLIKTIVFLSKIIALKRLFKFSSGFVSHVIFFCFGGVIWLFHYWYYPRICHRCLKQCSQT